jgi:hypothetical protein
MMDKYGYELLSAITERTIKRLWVLCIMLLLALFISNISWIIYESQFNTETTTTIEATQDGKGTNNVVNGGDCNCGTDSEDNSN